MSKAKAPEWMVKIAKEEAAHWIMDGPQENGPYIWQRIADRICQAIQDNPIVPTDEQVKSIATTWWDGKSHGYYEWVNVAIDQFQRRYMFRSEPEVPEALADLIHRYGIEEDSCEMQIAREAYRRGKESK